jgi:hypothetical protein
MAPPTASGADNCAESAVVDGGKSGLAIHIERR